MFWTIFGQFSDHLWGHFGDHLGTKSAQEGAKMGPRGPFRGSKNKTPAFAKTTKKTLFFHVLGSRRALGSPRRLPRCTQRAPKLQKIGSKNGPQNYICLDEFFTNFGGHFGVNNCSKRGPKIGQILAAILESSWACVGGVLGVRVRATCQQCSGPGPGRGKGRASKLIYFAYLAYLAA